MSWRIRCARQKIANSVDTHYEHGRLGGLVMITVKLKPRASTATAIDVLDEYLTEASRAGRLYPWDSFKDYKTRALVNEVAGLEATGSASSGGACTDGS